MTTLKAAMRGLADLARALLMRSRHVDERQNVDEPRGVGEPQDVDEPQRSIIVINLNPQTLGLLASVASGAIKAVPTSHLARFGLVRAPFAVPLAISPMPVAAAAAGGALVVALIVPSSRKWLISKATTLSTAVRTKLLANGSSENTSVEPESATDVANRHARSSRNKGESPAHKPAVVS